MNDVFLESFVCGRKRSFYAMQSVSLCFFTLCLSVKYFKCNFWEKIKPGGGKEMQRKRRSVESHSTILGESCLRQISASYPNKYNSLGRSIMIIFLQSSKVVNISKLQVCFIRWTLFFFKTTHRPRFTIQHILTLQLKTYAGLHYHSDWYEEIQFINITHVCSYCLTLNPWLFLLCSSNIHHIDCVCSCKFCKVVALQDESLGEFALTRLLCNLKLRTKKMDIGTRDFREYSNIAKKFRRSHETA